MLENLLKLVTDHAQDAIVNNNQIPNEHNNAAIESVTQSITSGLAGQLSGGNLAGIMQMFSGQGGNMANNPIVQNIIQSAAGNLAGKVGIDPNTATSVVSSLIPTVMSQLTHQTADPNNSNFDMNSVVSALSGGKTGGVDMNGILSQLTSGQGGGVDIAGIASQFLGGGGNNQSGGGIGGLISGFLK